MATHVHSFRRRSASMLPGIEGAAQCKLGALLSHVYVPAGENGYYVRIQDRISWEGGGWAVPGRGGGGGKSSMEVLPRVVLGACVGE